MEPQRRRRDKQRASKDPSPTKTWLAFRIVGSKSERWTGVIYADTRRAAETEAFKVFNATSEMARRKVYVREHP